MSIAKPYPAWAHGFQLEKDNSKEKLEYFQRLEFFLSVYKCSGEKQ